MIGFVLLCGSLLFGFGYILTFIATLNVEIEIRKFLITMFIFYMGVSGMTQMYIGWGSFTKEER